MPSMDSGSHKLAESPSWENEVSSFQVSVIPGLIRLFLLTESYSISL